MKLKVWQILLVFPVLAWMAWDDYQDFTRLEEQGGVLYVSRTTKLLYNLGGKWAVIALPVGLFLLWGWGLIVALRLTRRAEQLADGTAPPRERPPMARVVREGAPAAPRKPSLAPLASAAPAPTPSAPAAPTPEGDGPTLLR